MRHRNRHAHCERRQGILHWFSVRPGRECCRSKHWPWGSPSRESRQRLPRSGRRSEPSDDRRL